MRRNQSKRFRRGCRIRAPPFVLGVSIAPEDAQCAMGEDMKGKMMHAFMRIGDFSLMASDSPRAHFQTPQGYAVSLNYDDAAEAERIFGTLSEGGTVPMPAGPTFFARFFGMCVDKFGTPWMVNCPLQTCTQA